MQNEGQKQIVSAIIIVGVIIAGAILLRGSKPAGTKNEGIPVTTATLAPISKNDRVLGNPSAKVTVIMYEDFQCPFCGAISGLDSLSPSTQSLVRSLQQRDPTWTPFVSKIINDYVKNGSVNFVYRDFAFLGPESIRAAEAAWCAGDQGKFWEYHDYLFTHQNGENQGNFSDTNLKSFAKTLGLDNSIFDKCLDDSKYAQAVADSKNEGANAGVTGTPKGYILKDGKIAGTIDGAESYGTVKPKVDAALK